MLVFKQSRTLGEKSTKIRQSIRKGMLMCCSYVATAVHSPVNVHSATPAHTHTYIPSHLCPAAPRMAPAGKTKGPLRLIGLSRPMARSRCSVKVMEQEYSDNSPDYFPNIHLFVAQRLPLTKYIQFFQITDLLLEIFTCSYR